MPGRYRPAPCASRPDRGRWAAASACSPASGGCACRCRGRASRTATRGRSRRATGSCSSTPARTSRARSASSSARSTRSACGSSTCACSSAPTRTPTTAARRARSSSARAASCGPTPTTQHFTALRRRPRGGPRPPRRDRAPERRAGGAAAHRGRPLAAGPLQPDRDLLPGVEVETDLGTWSVHETPGHAPSHVCLFQRRAAAADLRRPPAGPRLALLRLRLHARPGRRVPRLARHHRRARRAARAERPRPPVHRRPRAPRGQPPARAASASTRSLAALADGPSTAYDLAPRGLRRGVHPRASRPGC